MYTAGGAEGHRVPSRGGAQGELICFSNHAQLPNQTKDETITNYNTQQQHKQTQQPQQQQQQQQQQQHCSILGDGRHRRGRCGSRSCGLLTYVPLARNNAECQGVPLGDALSSVVWICSAPNLALCDNDRASDRVTVERSSERGRHANLVVREPRDRPALTVGGICAPSISVLQRQRRTRCPKLPGQVWTGARSRALCGSSGQPRPAGHHRSALSGCLCLHLHLHSDCDVDGLNDQHFASQVEAAGTSRPFDTRCCLLSRSKCPHVIDSFDYDCGDSCDACRC